MGDSWTRPSISVPRSNFPTTLNMPSSTRRSAARRRQLPICDYDTLAHGRVAGVPVAPARCGSEALLRPGFDLLDRLQRVGAVGGDVEVGDADILEHLDPLPDVALVADQG